MSDLSPQQSHYVLETLIARGRVRASDVARALADRGREIRQLRERLASLEALGKTRSRARGRRARPQRRLQSARVHALRKLQGSYMGFVRRLNLAQKARVRALREKQGIQAAIRLASSLTKR